MSGTDIFAIVLTGIGFLNCMIFCLAYWVRTRGQWIRDEAGQFLMLFFGCLGFVLGLVLANRIFGEYPGRQILVFVLYFALVMATFWPMRLLWTSRREKKKRRRNQNGKKVSDPRS